jgi:hypothetical protein
VRIENRVAQPFQFLLDRDVTSGSYGRSTLANDTSGYDFVIRLGIQVDTHGLKPVALYNSSFA